MIRQIRPLAEITAEAFKILYQEIGVVDTLRFVSQYTTGCGDYTAQREKTFGGMTLDDMISEITHRRRLRPSASGKKTKPKKKALGKSVRTKRDSRHKTR